MNPTDTHTPPILHTWKRWLLVAGALLPVAAMALYSYFVAADSVRKLVRQNNDAAAQTTAVLVRRELARSVDFAETLAQLPGTINLVEQRDEFAMSERLQAVVETYEGIDRATVSDINGIMWSDFPHGGEALGRNVADREWFMGVATSWQPYVSNLYQRLSDNQRRVVAIAAPIKRDKRPIGVICIHYRIEKLAEWLGKIRVGGEGQVLVLDSKGTVLVHPQLDLQERQYDEYAALPPIRGAIGGAARSAEYADPFDGRKMVASIVPVNFADTHWMIIAQQPRDDAYQPIRSLWMQIAIAGLIVALLASLAITLLGRISSKVVRLNDELRERNHKLEQLAHIVQSSNDAILSTTLDGIITSWNPGAERMFGYSPKDAIGRSASIYIPASHGGEMTDLLRRVRGGERIENHQTVRLTKDGKERIVSQSIAPLLSENGAIEGTTTIARDVTAQRRAELALRESIERFSLVARGTNDGLWDWNIETNAVYFSSRWKAMLGYADDEIKNNFAEWESRLHPDDRDKALVTLRDYLENRSEHYELEHRMLHKDGSYRWILARGFALRNAAGKPYRMAGSHIDLTERREAAEKLAIKAAELARSNAELEQFAYVASHDLREPLRMIGSFGMHLAKRNKGKLDAVSEQYLKQVLDGAERMKTLIADLLEFSRVGMQGRTFEAIDCNKMLEFARQNLKLAIDESGGTVESGPLPTITGDGVQLTQVFQNLIGNALKFKGAEPPRVQIAAVRKGKLWEISVRDNGIGMEAAHFKRIFAIFTRLHTRDEYAGTGIGLALCKRIVERHGGTIWVESEPGKGSTFYFTLAA